MPDTVQWIAGSERNKGVARNRVDVVRESALESFSIATCLEVLPGQGDTRLKIELSINTNTGGFPACEMHTDGEVKGRCTSAFWMGPPRPPRAKFWSSPRQSFRFTSPALS